MKITIKGSRLKLNKSLIDKKVREALEVALAEGAAIISTDASNRAPVDMGNLTNSITYEVRVSKDGYRGIVFTNVEYAPYVEYGTGLYAENGRGRKTGWYYKNSRGDWIFTRGQRPQPFLRPALEDNQAQVLKRIADKMRGSL